MKNDVETLPSAQSLKPRKPKSREVSSRFLSPISTPSHDAQPISPLSRKSTSGDTRKQPQHRSLEDSASLKGLWPSSSTSNKPNTLADHLGNDRLEDYIERKQYLDQKSRNHAGFSLSRQISCSEFTRFEGEKECSTKENYRPSLGGSMRYTGKSNFTGKSSITSSSSSSSSHFADNTILPGRLSVDEKVFCRRPSRKHSDVFSTDQNHTHDSESEYSNRSSPSLSFRKPSMEVSSKYLQEIPTSTRRGTPDSTPASAESSPRTKKFSIKNAIKRANSLTGYSSAMSQWALSPGRSGSPPVSVETKSRPMSFSSFSLKPPTSPSRSNGVEKILNLGLMELFKSKKSSSLPFDVGSVHQLRLLHNRLMQWRFANARADAVNLNLLNQVETNSVCSWDNFTKLQHSVVQKKIKLQKKKLEMKLDFILQSQMKYLEAWGDIERQHLTTLSITKESLHSVVCRVPLVEGAKVDLQSASNAIRYGSDITISVMSTLNIFFSLAERTVRFISQLAKVVAQEKLLLEECHEHFTIISQLTIEEMSLKSELIQREFLYQQQQLQKEKTKNKNSYKYIKFCNTSVYSDM